MYHVTQNVIILKKILKLYGPIVNLYLINLNFNTLSKFIISFRFNSGYTEAATLRGHTSFVSCVCVLPPSKDFREGLILTGGCDKKICVFQLNSFDPFMMLEDHKDNGMGNFKYRE